MRKKLYVSKKQWNLAILLTVALALFLMQFAPWGSFNPARLGFWTSVLTAVTSAGLTDYFLAKYRVEDKNKE